ncbi:MAG: DUF3090 family protein [Anaerolineae bacterium]|jgi:uncharacterized repeat protein (TIGR03847 family)|nr:DUF3090 family protein [Anaerolineae bacterium]
MAKTELDLNPVDFITIGTIGPKGKRIFHLQAGAQDRLISFLIEKEQAWALSDAIREFLDDLDERDSRATTVEMAAMDMDLREPIQPLFRVSQMGLAYDESDDKIILIAQEAVITAGEGEEEEPQEEPGVVRMWCSRRQMRALSLHALDMVEQGRPSPKQNGRITYYWT